jgi:hypothetical protein
MLLASYYHFSLLVEQSRCLFFLPASCFFLQQCLVFIFSFSFALGLKLEVGYCLPNMPKPLDPFYQYGEAEDGTNQQRLSCKLCGQPMTRGISRLKHHLAKKGTMLEFVVRQPQRLCKLPAMLFMRRIKRRKRQLLPKLNLPPVEWLDPQEPQTDLGLEK